MAYKQPLRSRYVLAVFVLLFSVALTFADSKVVRLRNEHISTPEKKSNAGGPKADQAHNGLFLIQFTGPMDPAWADQLRQRNVTLVRYVPDHAYIARANGAKLSSVEDLPFVRWTGPFRPDLKILNSLKASKAPSDDLSVSVLLAPDASPRDIAGARGLMKKMSSESNSRFGRVWRGVVGRGQLNALAASDAVLWIERGPKIKLFDETASKIVGGENIGHPTYVQSLGYDGRGVSVAVADSGLHLGTAEQMHPDLLGRVDAFFHYGSSLSDASDEHSHGTHVAGIVAGNGATGELDDYGALWGLGVAPGAHIIAQRLFDGEGGYTPDGLFTFELMTRDATDAGADIGSNSWGDDTQGRYDISAAEFDALVRDANELTPGDQPYILEFSAGNAGPGPQTIGSPAVAKNVIATGASQNNRFDYFIYADGQETMADFSSRGPAEDGRIKPDLVAPGTWISSLRSPVGNDEFAWGEISHYYMFQGGTSQAGPHVSGAAAIFVQWYRENYTNATPSPALVKATFINSAIDMDDSVETGPVPNSDEGWGRIDLAEIIGSDRVYDFVDQSIKLSTGQQFERHLVVADDTLPLFVTLAYTDVPGFPGAVPALVNDLDLEVVAPDGRIFRGNQFLEGDSIADSPGVDALNNVECVFIGQPQPGQYIMRVKARNVPQDARIDTAAIDQDFALVTSGDLPVPGTGFVFFDRRAYTVPGTINVRVIDTDLQGQPSVNVTVRSTTQPAGVALALQPSGIPGTFTGSVATATTTIANRLRIAHNDSITTDYFDTSEGLTRTATARGDLLPPVISGIGTSNSFGKTVVFWQTDELANSIVRYHTNSTLLLGSTNNTLVTGHRISLDNLIPGRTYFFLVISEDEAGNRSTNNNGGALYSFVAPVAPTVLLVENYQTDPFGWGPEVPLSVYTSTLNQLGVSYDVWNMVSGAPSPTINDLRPYRVVMWRVSDSVLINNTLSGAEQAAVQQYVQEGGAFFMSSMEILTRASPSFVSNVLQVSVVDIDGTAPAAFGVPGNLISGGGMNLSLNYSNYSTETYDLLGVPPDISDTITPNTNAFPILVEDFNNVVGLAYPRLNLDRTGRVVFLAFPLDAVSSTDLPPHNRASLMQRILNFLAPGHQGIGAITLNNTEYTLPSQAIVEVGDSDLAGAGQLQVTVKSTTQPAGITLTLPEFGRFGIFRGEFSIVATNSANPAGQLRAANGDTILASYLDVGGVSVTFTARVETILPTISNRGIEEGYVDAFIYWDTSEPCDALVQYGESELLGRSAYVPTLGTSHEVYLDGLIPDHEYVYQIVSRDNAGNVRVDDNNGAFYRFRTLAPLTPAWLDTLEANADNWFAYNPVEESELQWEYGVPNINGVTAHSGTKVWASNLNGESAGFVESYLISPAIYLTGGNRAILRFWQNYDFTVNEDDFFHLGELAIVTNINSEPLTLDVYEDELSGSWEEAEYDLSPHVGKLVYIVWHYIYFSFGNTPAQGWIIDDISITMSNTAAGVLRITNNLSQASFTVSGPVSFSAQGNSYIETNAPPGQYTVSWAPVAYWQTPNTQSNVLVAPGTTVFTGNYTLTDVNNNGMSDSWEQAWFGSVSPGRTEFTDSDQDGMTDRAEFYAGTIPTNELSVLKFFTPAVQNTGAVRFDWQTVPGRSYRITSAGSSMTNWVLATDWMRANGSLLSFTTNVTAGTRFYRLEVRP